MIWPLFSSILFGVILNEFYVEERPGGFPSSQRISEREFFILLSCTCVLELFYFSDFSLFGFVLVSFALWISLIQLGYDQSSSPQLGSDYSESFFSTVMSPIRHILSERKSRKIALFLLINTLYMCVEFTVGFMSNSLGLISDACHMLFDCAALGIGLYASYISRLPGNSHFNYGRGRFEVLSGYVNAVFLVLVGALIVVESFERILDPQEISTSSLLSVSIGGLLVNLVGLVFFHEEHHHAHGGSAPCLHSHAHHSHSHTHHSHSHSQKHDHAYSHNHEQVGNCCQDHHEDEHQSHGACRLSSNHHHDHHGSGQHPHGSHEHHHGSVLHHHGSREHQHDHHHSHQHLQAHESYSNTGDKCCAENLGRLKGKDQDDSSFLVHEEDNHVISHSHSASHGGHSQSCIQVQSDSHSCSVHKCSHGRDSNRPSKEHNKHHHVDHNMEGIFLHVLADTMGSLGVVISTLLIKYKGWLIADPACSIFISVMIVSSVLPLLRNSAEILLQRVPRLHEQEVKEALEDVLQIKGVYDIQNFHVWSLTNTDVVGTLHLHVSAENNGLAKEQVASALQNAGINDLTLQLEYICK